MHLCKIFLLFSVLIGATVSSSSSSAANPKYFSSFSYDQIDAKIGSKLLFEENIPCCLKYRMESFKSSGEEVDLDILEICNKVFLNEIQPDPSLRRHYQIDSESYPWKLIHKLLSIKGNITESKRILSNTLMHPICQEALLSSEYAPLPQNIFLEILPLVDSHVFSLNINFLKNLTSFEWLTPHLASLLFRPLWPLVNPFQWTQMIKTLPRETFKYFLRLKNFDLSYTEFSLLSDLRSDLLNDLDGLDGIAIKLLFKLYASSSSPDIESDLVYDHQFLEGLLKYFTNDDSNQKPEDSHEIYLLKRSILRLIVEYQNCIMSKEIVSVQGLWDELHKNDHIEYRFAFLVNSGIVQRIEERKMERFMEEGFNEFKTKFEKEIEWRNNLLTILKGEFDDILTFSSTFQSLLIVDKNSISPNNFVKLLLDLFIQSNFFKTDTPTYNMNCRLLDLLQERSTELILSPGSIIFFSDSYTFPTNICSNETILSLLKIMYNEEFKEKDTKLSLSSSSSSSCTTSTSSIPFVQIAKIKSYFASLQNFTLEEMYADDVLKFYLTQIPGLISENVEVNPGLEISFNISKYFTLPSEYLLSKLMQDSASVLDPTNSDIIITKTSGNIILNTWGLASIPLDVLITFFKLQGGLFTPTAQFFWSLHPDYWNIPKFTIEIWEYINMEIMLESAGGKEAEVMKILSVASSAIYEHLQLIDLDEHLDSTGRFKRQLVLICKWLITQEMHALFIWKMLLEFPHKAGQMSQIYNVYTELESISRNDLCKWIKEKLSIFSLSSNPSSSTIATLNALLAITRNLPLSFIRLFFSNSSQAVSKQFKTLLKSNDQADICTKISRNILYIRGVLHDSWNEEDKNYRSTTQQSFEIWQSRLDMLSLLNSDGTTLRDSNAVRLLLSRCFLKSKFEKDLINSFLPPSDSSLLLFITKIFSSESLKHLK